MKTIHLCWIKKFLYFLGYLKTCFYPFSCVKKEYYIPVDDLFLKDFQPIYLKVRDLLNLYEEKAPAIMKNGTKRSFQSICFSLFLSWIIPLVLGINTVISWCFNTSLIEILLNNK